MHVLGVIHGEAVRSGVFGEVAASRGHVLEEWSLAWGTPPPRPISEYAAVFIFGGAMHADQDDHHPWLRDEQAFIQRLLELRIPVLGVCLGAQLMAKASGGGVYPATAPEIGWFDVEATPRAAHDPLLGRLPSRFEAFQWHYYTYDLPTGSHELARSEICTQAFRLGERAWGIQFHAEVTEAQIRKWVEQEEERLPAPAPELLRATRGRIGGWNELGRRLCTGFFEVAEAASPAAVRAAAR